MQGPTFREEPQVTVTQAARILGISHQAVSQAVERGVLKAKGPWRHRRVPLSQVIVYGIRRRTNAEALTDRIKKELGAPIDWLEVLAKVLEELGLRKFVYKPEQSEGKEVEEGKEVNQRED